MADRFHLLVKKPLALVMALVFVPAVGMAASPSPAAPAGQQVVLTVNQTEITRTELERLNRLISTGHSRGELERIGAKPLGMHGSAHLPTPTARVKAGQEAEARLQDVREQALQAARDKAIEMALLHEAALQEPAPADLEARLTAKMTERRSRFKTDLGYANALKDAGMTEDELREFSRKEVLIAAYVERTFMKSVQVGEADVRKFYDDNLVKFLVMPEKRRVSHVLVRRDTGKVTPAKQSAARHKAEQLRERIVGGEAFAQVARTASDCPSASVGGDLSFIAPDTTPKRFEDVVYQLRQGEISPVVETPLGYHIVQVTQIEDAVHQPYERVRSGIESQLRTQAARAAIDAFVAQRRQTAKIVFLDPGTTTAAR